MKFDSQRQPDVMAELQWEPAVHATQFGVPKDQVIKYEAAPKADTYLQVVHRSAADQDKARGVLALAKTTVAA